MSYEMIKHNFDRGLWNAAMVAVAGEKKVITPEQYQAITGEAYSV